MLKMLAMDYGASSGRAILGHFDGETLYMEEIHRFSNDPVNINGSLYWDILRLFHELKQAVIKCIKAGKRDLNSMGIDTWGVDFGLLDSSGKLLGNPFHYRDSRTEGIMEKAFDIVPKEDIYRMTGIQLVKFNTLFQLLAMKEENSPLLDMAAHMLMIPDLLNYFLTGIISSEFTVVSTTQMYNPVEKSWAKPLLGKLGLPERILTDIIKPAMVLGHISPSLQDELNLGRIPVIAVAGHDTASAVAAVPAKEDRFVYISSGTWSLLGVELPHPVINDTTFSLNCTNEGGINGTTRLLKNIMGLWIIQECKREWDMEGNVLTFDTLEQMALQAKPFSAFIDPDDDLFYAPGNMPEKIRKFCLETDQNPPETIGEIVRCVMESLALKYRLTIEGLEDVLGYELPVIHIVGGGSKNTMLCRFTADAAGKPVIAGPAEATAAGNLSSQLMALGEISSLTEVREIIAKSCKTAQYTPVDTWRWDDAYGGFLSVLKRRKERLAKNRYET